MIKKLTTIYLSITQTGETMRRERDGALNGVKHTEDVLENNREETLFHLMARQRALMV